MAPRRVHERPLTRLRGKTQFPMMSVVSLVLAWLAGLQDLHGPSLVGLPLVQRVDDHLVPVVLLAAWEQEADGCQCTSHQHILEANVNLIVMEHVHCTLSLHKQCYCEAS